MAKLDKDGSERCDRRPVEVPLDWKKPVSLNERIRRLARAELSALARAEDKETFEEADDFEVDDDFDPRSPWELDFDQEIAKIENGRESMKEDGPYKAMGESPTKEKGVPPLKDGVEAPLEAVK